MSKLDLSVIVLSYNTKDITDECLTKLKEAAGYCEKTLQNSVEVIVIENASSDSSAEMIKKKHPWVNLIISKTNTGFSGGNNLGMKKSSKPFILLLNSDAFVQKETLSTALQYFADHEECGVLGCQLRFADGRVQPSAGFLPTPFNTIFWISGFALLPFFNKLAPPIHPKDKAFFGHEHQVEWVMGAFFMLKREVYTKTGGFDESIFMYGEEVELCKRIKDLGYKMFYVPEFFITHLDKASSKFLLEKPLLNEIKGIVRYFHQHYPKDYSYVRLVIWFSLMLRIFAFAILGKGQRIKAYKEALSAL